MIRTIDSTISVVNSPLIHAGPTAGKTRLSKLLEEKSISVIDTDDIIEEKYPQWFKSSLWKLRHDKFYDLTHSLLALAVGFEMRKRLDGSTRKTVGLTNLWGASFLDGYVQRGEGREHLPVSFMVRNPEEIVRRSSVRGGTQIDLKLAKKWVEQWETIAPTCFKSCFWLEDDQYLSEVLDFSRYVGNVRERSPQPNLARSGDPMIVQDSDSPERRIS